MNWILRRTILATLVLFAGCTTLIGTPAPDPTTDEFERRVEVAIHEEFNEGRAGQNEHKLTHPSELRQFARNHSESMAKEGELFTGGPNGSIKDRLDEYDYRCRTQTESGGYVYGYGKVAKTWYRTPVESAILGETVVHNTVEELAEDVETRLSVVVTMSEVNLNPRWQTEGIGVEIVTEDGDYAVYVTQVLC